MRRIFYSLLFFVSLCYVEAAYQNFCVTGNELIFDDGRVGGGGAGMKESVPNIHMNSSFLKILRNPEKVTSSNNSILFSVSTPGNVLQNSVQLPTGLLLTFSKEASQIELTLHASFDAARLIAHAPFEKLKLIETDESSQRVRLVLKDDSRIIIDGLNISLLTASDCILYQKTGISFENGPPSSNLAFKHHSLSILLVKEEPLKTWTLFMIRESASLLDVMRDRKLLESFIFVGLLFVTILLIHQGLKSWDLELYENTGSIFEGVDDEEQELQEFESTFDRAATETSNPYPLDPNEIPIPKPKSKAAQRFRNGQNYPKEDNFRRSDPIDDWNRRRNNNNNNNNGAASASQISWALFLILTGIL